MSRRLIQTMAGILSTALLVQGTFVFPAFAETEQRGEAAAGTYADIAGKAGNDVMKVYGAGLEKGTLNTSFDPTTIPEGTGITYYVDAADGDDANDGTSEESAWKSVEKVNQGEYNSGDRIVVVKLFCNACG